MNKIEQAESILKKYNQNHIKIKTEEQAEQILEIDFAQLEELYQYAINKKNIDDIENIVLKEDDYLNYSQNHIIIETFIRTK